MVKKRKPGRRKHFLWLLYYKLFRSSERFSLAGVEYPYFYHWYNRTWRNERTVEIPIVRRILEARPGACVLEVGNVLSHYFGRDHEVVDKYEKAHGVHNIDVVDFRPGKKYDVIVCISTLEHVGWDDPPRDPEKPIRALNHLRSLLAPGGILVVTIPIGYNPDIDGLIGKGRLEFNSLHFIKRTTLDNRWTETDWSGVAESRYNTPYPAANALAIGIIEG